MWSAWSPIAKVGPPISISEMIWAGAMLGVVAIHQRNLRIGVLAGLVVLSHWPLDWLVHVPDLTLDGQL